MPEGRDQRIDRDQGEIEMTGVRRSLVAVAAVTALVAFTATGVEAQVGPAPRPAPKAKRAKEFLIGGIVAGPSVSRIGDCRIAERPGATSVTLFRRTTRSRPAPASSRTSALQIGRALWVEVTGGCDAREREHATSAPISRTRSTKRSRPTMSRFTLEGGVVRYFHDEGSRAWFARGTGGWMREMAGGNTLTARRRDCRRRLWIPAVVAHQRQGLGEARRSAGRGPRESSGTGGISLGEKGVRFGPAGAAHLVFWILIHVTRFL